MSILQNINDWIVQHQALVISVGIPTFPVLAGFFGSYLVHKTKADEIKLNGRLKLADFRKQNFDEIKDQIAKLENLLNEALISKVMHNEGERTVPTSEFKELFLVANKISVLIRADEMLAGKYSEAVQEAIAHVTFAEDDEDTQIQEMPLVKLRRIARDILSAEWRLLELELKNLA